MTISKIISGGQSGVDRSALDFSLQFNIDCSGWCPKGRMAEDGIIPIKYPLIETKETEPIYRTIKNIEASDGTLIIYRKNLDKGSHQTLDYAQKIEVPVLLFDLSKLTSVDEIQNWIISNQINILNIAGSRESNSPGIYHETFDFLKKIQHLF